MATQSRRLAPGLLFVSVSALAVIKIFETRIVSFLSPYMGGKKLCVENTANLPDVTTFGPKEGCVHIKQSAADLVNRVELGLAILAGILLVYIFIKLVFKKLKA